MRSMSAATPMEPVNHIRLVLLEVMYALQNSAGWSQPIGNVPLEVLPDFRDLGHNKFDPPFI